MLEAYSLAKDGGKRSGNFKVREFRCNDGSDTIFIDSALVVILNQIREHFGKPVIINSGYRTETYNKRIGGAQYSQHKYGKAADICIRGIAPQLIADYANDLMRNYGGIGIYNTFVHIDVRDNRARWRG